MACRHVRDGAYQLLGVLSSWGPDSAMFKVLASESGPQVLQCVCLCAHVAVCVHVHTYECRRACACSKMCIRKHAHDAHIHMHMLVCPARDTTNYNKLRVFSPVQEDVRTLDMAKKTSAARALPHPLPPN